MSFHNRFWTLADLGDESNDPNDGDAHSTQRAGWSKTLLRPAFWVAMHRLLGDEESHVVPQSVLDIGRPW